MLLGIALGFAWHAVLGPREDWSWNGWTGISALGQWAAAIFTLATLIFFWFQLIDALRRAEDERDYAATPLIRMFIRDGSENDARSQVEVTINIVGSGVASDASIKFTAKSPESQLDHLTFFPDEFLPMSSAKTVITTMSWSAVDPPVKGDIVLTFVNGIGHGYSWTQAVELKSRTQLALAGRPKVIRSPG